MFILLRFRVIVTVKKFKGLKLLYDILTGLIFAEAELQNDDIICLKQAIYLFTDDLLCNN